MNSRFSCSLCSRLELQPLFLLDARRPPAAHKHQCIQRHSSHHGAPPVPAQPSLRPAESKTPRARARGKTALLTGQTVFLCRRRRRDQEYRRDRCRTLSALISSPCLDSRPKKVGRSFAFGEECRRISAAFE